MTVLSAPLMDPLPPTMRHPPADGSSNYSKLDVIELSLIYPKAKLINAIDTSDYLASFPRKMRYSVQILSSHCYC